MTKASLSLSHTHSLFLSLSLSLSPPEQQLEGDLEMLAVVTYTSICMSMVALLVTVMVLSCLRGLKSNTRSIHANMAAATLLSQLTYLLGPLSLLLGWGHTHTHTHTYPNTPDAQPG